MSVKKVLVVDDSKTELMFMTDLLQKSGFLVRTAENAEEAMRRLAEDTPDLDEAATEIKHHHYRNYADSRCTAPPRAIGLRFVDFIDSNREPPADDDARLWH